MKRTPLQRKTPLRSKPPAVGAPKPRSALRPRSPKREVEMAARRPLVAALLKEFPRCQVRWLCDGAPAVDVHERLKRSRGGSITDPRHGHMVTACRRCHEETERDPAEATRRRMLLPSWHTCPPIGPC